MDLTFGDRFGQTYMRETPFMPTCSLNVAQSYLNEILNYNSYFKD